jgi:hypothetical protein
VEPSDYSLDLKPLQHFSHRRRGYFGYSRKGGRERKPHTALLRLSGGDCYYEKVATSSKYLSTLLPLPLMLC